MKNKISIISRYLLGLIYFIFGLNGFFNFIPMQPMPEAAGAFAGALGATGYFFPFLKGTEVLCGALLLSGFAVPLALVVLAPITLNILLFHTILTPGLQYAVLPVLMVLMNIAAALNYWHIFGRMFKKNP